MSGKTLFLVFAVMLLVIGGVAFALVSSVGPSIFNPVQASSSVSAAPENQNSGILSTPTVKVISTETLVPTVVETPKPLAAETSVPSPTPTAVVTVDPDKVWPEFPWGSSYVTNLYTIEIDPVSKDLYGVKGRYFRNVEKIEEYEGGFKIYGEYPANDMYIKVTGSDTDWIYMTVNSVNFKVRPGTIMWISSAMFPGPLFPWEVGGTAFVMFDPVEQKFVSDSKTGETNLPLSTYFVVLRSEDVVDIGYWIGEQVFFAPDSRKAFCGGLYNDIMSNWKWSDSSIVHDPRFEGCPYVEVVK